MSQLVEGSADTRLGSLIPIGRRMSSPLPVKMVDASGDPHTEIGEGFFSGHQVFMVEAAGIEPPAEEPGTEVTLSQARVGTRETP